MILGVFMKNADGRKTGTMMKTLSRLGRTMVTARTTMTTSTRIKMIMITTTTRRTSTT